MLFYLVAIEDVVLVARFLYSTLASLCAVSSVFAGSAEPQKRPNLLLSGQAEAFSWRVTCILVARHLQFTALSCWNCTQASFQVELRVSSVLLSFLPVQCENKYKLLEICQCFVRTFLIGLIYNFVTCGCYFFYFMILCNYSSHLFILFSPSILYY